MRTKTDRRRPWKVVYHYDGTRRHGENGLPWIDHSTPIDAKSSHREEAAARKLADDVSRRGGYALVSYVSPDTGVVNILLERQPYEIAMLELAVGDE